MIVWSGVLWVLYICYMVRPPQRMSCISVALSERRRWIILLRTGEPPVIQFMYYIKFLVEVVGPPLPSLRQRYNVMCRNDGLFMLLTCGSRNQWDIILQSEWIIKITTNRLYTIAVWSVQKWRISARAYHMWWCKCRWQGKGKWFCTGLCSVHKTHLGICGCDFLFLESVYNGVRDRCGTILLHPNHVYI